MTLRGEVSLYKPGEKSFELKGRFTLPPEGKRMYFSHPVINNGILYIRAHNNLYVYSIKIE